MTQRRDCLLGSSETRHRRKYIGDSSNRIIEAFFDSGKRGLSTLSAIDENGKFRKQAPVKIASVLSQTLILLGLGYFRASSTL